MSDSIKANLKLKYFHNHKFFDSQLALTHLTDNRQIQPYYHKQRECTSREEFET
jgi:hypothetical protein